MSDGFTGVKTAMLLHVPFFASLLLDMMDVKVGKFEGVFPPGNETMATDGKTIWMDQDFIDNMPIENAVFATAHEIGHAMWEHMARGKRYMDLGFDGQEFHPMLYNIAADFVINDMLVKAGVGKMMYKDGKPCWLLDPKYTCDMTVEEVYRDLLKNAKKGKPPPGMEGAPGDGRDVHIFNGDQISPAETKRAIQTAVDTA